MSSAMSGKPSVQDPMTAETFGGWFWTKPELTMLCKRYGLSLAGGKDELRARVRHFLQTGKRLTPAPRKRGGFDWARETLTLDTELTETVSFGPNLRRFMADQIGPSFTCTSDFMDWARSHPGSTLADAVIAWFDLDSRRADPAFRSSIAQHNNYLQYLRDFRDACPDLTQDHAKAAWARRKTMPMTGERIVFHPDDRGLALEPATVS